MTLPYHTVAVSPNYTQYRDAHYIDANNAAHYHQNVAYSTAALAYINGHHVTAPNVSRHTASRPRTSGFPDAPIVSSNRTVFLTKLPYSAVGQAVRRLLEAYGRVERCDVPLDRTSPNKIQGTAIAKFNQSDDAARAIDGLNGSTWKGVTISARWDRDSATTSSAGSTSQRPAQVRHGSSGAGRAADAKRDDNRARDHRRRPGQGPLIVNGSRGDVAPSRRRRGSQQDDSDSSDDDDEDGEDDSSGDGKSSLPLYLILADSL
jgi:RNA recognition motif-containing protein